MIDTPKDSPGRTPPKGGNDYRRDKGRGVPPSVASAPVTPDAAPGGAPVSVDTPVPADARASDDVSASASAGPAASSSPAASPAGATPDIPEPAGTGSVAADITGSDMSSDTMPPMPKAARNTSQPPYSTPPAPAGKRNPLVLPIAAGLGVVVLLAAWMILANRPDTPTIDPARVDALEGRLAALAPLPDRLTQLEAQGNAVAPLLARADQRVGALETSLPLTQQALAALRESLDQQGAALAGQQQRTDAQVAAARDTLNQTLQAATAQLAQSAAAAEAALAPKLSALEASQQQRLAALDASVQQRIVAAEQSSQQAAATRETQMDARFAALEQRETRIAAAEQRLNRLVASTALTTALEDGKPLAAAFAGLPGTPPPALARYANVAPPTIASLRLSFDSATRAARAAAEPATSGQGVLEAAATRLSNLVTIRRGDNVVWGDNVSGELEGARQALEAGDLAAAAQKVSALPEPARTPMADWLAQARGLLDARAALADLLAPRGQG